MAVVIVEYSLRGNVCEQAIGNFLGKIRAFNMPYWIYGTLKTGKHTVAASYCKLNFCSSKCSISATFLS